MKEKLSQLFARIAYLTVILSFLCSIGMATGAEAPVDVSKIMVTATAPYDNGRSSICSDDKGNLYCKTGGGDYRKKVVGTNLPRIEAIAIRSLADEDFIVISDGTVYEVKKGVVIDISENLKEDAKEFLTGEQSNQIYVLTESGKIYYLPKEIGAPWKLKEIKTGVHWNPEGAVSAKKNTQGVLASNSVATSNFSGGKLKPTSSNESVTYAVNSVPSDNLTAEIVYVSEAVGNNTDAIYRINIKGKKLNTQDIFTTGYNGFKYTISTNDPKYTKDAYPLLGGIYSSDGKDIASLEMREISFLWLGPKCDIGKTIPAIITEAAYNYKDNKTSELGSVKTNLPASGKTPDYSNYRVEIKTNDGSSGLITESNGTCAVPFNILIRDSQGNVLPSEDNAYEHVVFYTADGSKVKVNGLIGCDPYSIVSDYIAILSGVSTEIDAQYIKYGTLGKTCKTLGGRTFYAYVKADGAHKIYAGLVYRNDLDGQSSVDISINGKTEFVSILPDYGINNPGGRNFTFSGGTAGSNWQGNQWGYGGYLDFQLTEYNNYKGVFFYLPEGLNTRSFEARKDIRSSSLTIGYYADPQVKQESPLLASNYHMNDTTSYCDVMRGRQLYFMAFDQYGRCATYSVQDNDGAKDGYGNNLWENRSKGKDSDRSKTLNMLMMVGNFYNTPIIMGSTSDSKSHNLGVTQRGLFVPPITSGANASFMTDVSVWINDDNYKNETLFQVEGDKLTVPALDKNVLFTNQLTILHREPLQVTSLKSEGNYPALNMVRILSPGWQVSDWLDVWGVFFIPKDDGGFHFQYWYGFNQGDIVGCVFGQMPGNCFTKEGYVYSYTKTKIARWADWAWQGRAWTSSEAKPDDYQHVTRPSSPWPIYRIKW